MIIKLYIDNELNSIYINDKKIFYLQTCKLIDNPTSNDQPSSACLHIYIFCNFEDVYDQRGFQKKLRLGIQACVKIKLTSCNLLYSSQLYILDNHYEAAVQTFLSSSTRMACIRMHDIIILQTMISLKKKIVFNCILATY